MATKLAVLLLAAAVNINTLPDSLKHIDFNEGDCGWQMSTDVENLYNFYCPHWVENVQIYKEKDNLVIECKTSPRFEFTMYPNLHLYEVRNVTLHNCIVDEIINFGLILEHFGINNTKYFAIYNTEKSIYFKHSDYSEHSEHSEHSLPLSKRFESWDEWTVEPEVITKLDENVFQALKEIRELTLYGNNIKHLPENIFANLSNLEMLQLAGNEIKSIYEGLFRHQKKLKHLRLNENNILDLPRIIFANLTSLEWLEVTGNKIGKLDKSLFTHQKKLKTLSLLFNEISYLPRHIFSNLKNLQNLWLSDNNIDNLDKGLFTHQKKLKKLSLGHNVISYLPRNIFANLTNLEKLWLFENKIKIIKEGLFTHQKKLIYLNLTVNEISYLPRNIFANLTNLEMLLLSQNKIEFLEEGLFTHQKKLKRLLLAHNAIWSSPGNIFANLTSLKALQTSRNEADIVAEVKSKINRLEVFSKEESLLPGLPINNKPTKLFLHRLKISNGLTLSSNFEVLTIKECEFVFDSGKNVSNITALAPSGKRVNSILVNIFANQKMLTYLSLEMIGLSELNDALFNGLNKLEHLDLSYNNLTIISGLIFRELHNLHIILLHHNHIKSINSDAFVNTTKLAKLDLSYNQLQYVDSSNSPFINLNKLTSLNLSKNYLTTLPSGWKDIRTLHLLDLGFNNISSYNYSDVHNSKNKIYYKEYYQLSSHELKDTKYEEYLFIFLNNIALCDCSMLRFLLEQNKRVLNEFANHLTEICEEKEPRCNKIHDDSLYEYECNITEYVKCKCSTKVENILEVRCERPKTWNSSMSYLPIRPHIQKSIELYINQNIFTELPNLQNDVFVITIQASYNNISDIKLENIPPNLRFLDVSHNQIKTISADVIDALYNHRSLETFLIGNNKWQCDCYANTDKFIEFFTTTILMTDFQDTKGRLPTGAVIELSSKALKDYCAKEKHNEMLTILAVFSAITGILGILIVILLFRYKKPIKIWLYAHEICLCCIGEDEFDKDKKFDAFISYSYHDEDLAVSILNELESGNPTYKICIHERDFVPGRLIHQSISESMDNSCRTIIILSKNFLRSVWGLLEFRRAYETGLTERRMRLIIVINGDIGDSEQLEPTIKNYLKTHTYIKWGDPWFWQKMRYALPHRKRSEIIQMS